MSKKEIKAAKEGLDPEKTYVARRPEEPPSHYLFDQILFQESKSKCYPKFRILNFLINLDFTKFCV